MKTIKILKTRALMAAAVLLLCASCNSWLDVSPQSEVKYDDMFSTKNGFRDQLTGIYTAMCGESLYGAHLTYGMVDAMGQQYVWSQEAGNYYHFWRFEYSNSTCESIISAVWGGMYNTIANINILLQGIDEHRGVMQDADEKIYEGECYGLRAMLHFDLLRLFGKSMAAGSGDKAIPYVESISKQVTPLSTVAEVLDKCEADLQRASELLADDPIRTGADATTMQGTRAWRFNYYAVRALLARVSLYKGDKAAALRYAREVIESGKYPWVESNKVTTTTREERDGLFKSECIFTLNNRSLKELTEKYLRESSSNSVGNLLVTSPEVRDEIFETTTYGFDWRSNYLFEQMDGNYYGSTKLWQVNSETNNQQPLLRVSEMYLIAAECAPTTAEALQYLNELRHHRGFDESSDIKEEDVSGDRLNEAIGKEYRKEFIGEGQWFFYCKRMNRATMPDATVSFSRDFYVLPMPDQEKDYGGR